MTMRQNSLCTMHQVLHGYSGGHQLLASSIKLSKKTQRLMLLLSDLSGPSKAVGFGEYLTGYPVKEDSMYAFAKTWYAGEMQRPGCVWTHTLLIHEHDLDKIRDIANLLEYFVRPDRNDDERISRVTYESPLSINISKHRHQDVGPRDYGLVDNLIYALYGSEEPVFLAAENSEIYEKLILEVWNQQWPDLRNSFRFCTGSISGRFGNGNRFDLQVIPFEAVRSVRREFPERVIESGSDCLYPLDRSPWVEAVSRDILSDYDRDLRQFLWQYGSESSSTRTSVPKYAKVFDNVRTSLDWILDFESLVPIVADCFPSPNDGRRLKKGLFIQEVGESAYDPALDLRFLHYLSRSKHHSSFTAEDLNILERAKRIWDYQHGSVEPMLEDLLSEPGNEIGEAVVEGIAQAVTAESVESLIRNHRHIAQLLVHYNPSLALSSRIWDCPVESQKWIINALKASPLVDDPIRGQIVSAQLDAGADEIAYQVADWIGPSVVGIVLDWSSHESSIHKRDLPHSWYTLLASNPKEIVKWVYEQPKYSVSTFLLISKLLDPHSHEVRMIDDNFWTGFLEAFDHVEFLERQQFDSMAFMLSVGLYNITPVSSQLVSTGFPAVYGAASEDALSHRAWSMLESQLPRVGFFWDKCKKLRHGLVKQFAKHSWPPEHFIEAVRAGKILEHILSDSAWNEDEVQFLVSAADLAMHDKTISSKQLARLDRFRVEHSAAIGPTEDLTTEWAQLGTLTDELVLHFGQLRRASARLVLPVKKSTEEMDYRSFVKELPDTLSQSLGLEMILYLFVINHKLSETDRKIVEAYISSDKNTVRQTKNDVGTANYYKTVSRFFKGKLFHQTAKTVAQDWLTHSQFEGTDSSNRSELLCIISLLDEQIGSPPSGKK